MPTKYIASKSRNLRKSKHKKSRVYKRQTKIVSGGGIFGKIGNFLRRIRRRTKVALNQPKSTNPSQKSRLYTTVYEEVKKPDEIISQGTRKSTSKSERVESQNPLDELYATVPPRHLRVSNKNEPPPIPPKKKAHPLSIYPTATSSKKNPSSQHINHYWFKKWKPGQNRITDESAIKDLVELCKIVFARAKSESEKADSKLKNILVHCTTGTGKTGVFITLFSLINTPVKKMKTYLDKISEYHFVPIPNDNGTIIENVNEYLKQRTLNDGFPMQVLEMLKAIVYDRVNNLRLLRSNMVDNKEQLNFILEIIMKLCYVKSGSEYITLYDACINSKINYSYTDDRYLQLPKLGTEVKFTDVVKKCKGKQRKDKYIGDKQYFYGTVEEITTTPTIRKSDLQLYVNPRVREPGENCENYINGTQMYGYTEDPAGKTGFRVFASECPMDDKLDEFKMMCKENKIGHIVMLTELQSDGKSICFDYFGKDVNEPEILRPDIDSVEVRELNWI